MNIDTIAILGAGAWGTALANCACRAGNNVILCGRDPAVVERLAETRENPRLPGIRASQRWPYARRHPRPGASEAAGGIRRERTRVSRLLDRTAMLRAFSFNRLFCRYADATTQRFARWLGTVRPARAYRALSRIDLALRHASGGMPGRRRYLLTGFGSDGAPLIEVHSLR